LMQDAIVNSFKTFLVQSAMPNFYAKFAEAMEDGILTPEETASLRGIYNDMIDSAADWNDRMKEITGIDPFGQANRDANALTGAIRGITEESANVIAGQLMGVRVDFKQLLLSQARTAEIFESSLGYMAEIAGNTRHNVKLNDIDARLEEMNRYLKGLI
jgi:hypothetical protein